MRESGSWDAMISLISARSKSLGPMIYAPRRERIGALRELRHQCFEGFMGIIMIVMFGTRRWNVDFLDKFHV